MTDSGNVFEGAGVNRFDHELLAKSLKPSLRSRCHDGSLGRSMKLGGIRPDWFFDSVIRQHRSCRAGRRSIWGAEVRKDKTARGLESGSFKRHVQGMGLEELSLVCRGFDMAAQS